jgi:hypothetical protein
LLRANESGFQNLFNIAGFFCLVRRMEQCANPTATSSLRGAPWLFQWARSALAGALDCHGPAALAMTKED